MLYNKYPFVLPPLDYAYNALEPYIDTETMHYHYGKHYQTYINKLNAALAPFPMLHNKTLQELLSNPGALPQASRKTIIENGGGVYNHSLYFDKLDPKGSKVPSPDLQKEINSKFGTFDKMRKMLNDAAVSVFGSGWAFLARTKNGLEIVTTANQETTLDIASRIIIVFDVWEHAYYLKYKNERLKYIEGLWNVITFD